jgi:hypothetical protein
MGSGIFEIYNKIMSYNLERNKFKYMAKGNNRQQKNKKKPKKEKKK